MVNERVQSFVESLSDDEELYEYLQIVVDGVERNPRHVKRFLNSLTLHDLLARRLGIENYDKKVLTKLLVIQFRWPLLFQNLDVLLDVERTVIGGNEKDRNELFEREKTILSKIDLGMVSAFMKQKPFFTSVDNITDYISMSHLSTPFEAKTHSKESVLSKEDVKNRIVSGDNFIGVNIMDLNLTGYDLSHLDLRGANLVGADLSHAKLMKANLRGANLERATLYGTDVSGADLSKVNLWRASMRNVINLDEVVSLQFTNFFGVSGLSERDQQFVAENETISLGDYGAFFDFYKNKLSMTDEEIRQVFTWCQHEYFKFILITTGGAEVG